MRLGIVGCKGRLGRLIVAQAVLSASNTDGADRIQLAAAVKPTDDGADIGTLAGLAPIGQAASANLDQVAAATDVLIDVSHASSASKIAQACAKHRTALVCGATGHNAAELEALHTAATKTAVLIAANFSPGLTLLLRLVRDAAAALGTEYDIEISDMHHRNKVDSPSGTALALGRAAAQGRDVDLESVACLSREGQIGPRQQGEIGFATLRGGAVVGQHTVLFAGNQEHLALTHEATDRAIFAAGAVRAACWLSPHPPGLYSMEHVLGL